MHSSLNTKIHFKEVYLSCLDRSHCKKIAFIIYSRKQHYRRFETIQLKVISRAQPDLKRITLELLLFKSLNTVVLPYSGVDVKSTNFCSAEFMKVQHPSNAKKCYGLSVERGSKCNSYISKNIVETYFVCISRFINLILKRSFGLRTIILHRLHVEW